MAALRHWCDSLAVVTKVQGRIKGNKPKHDAEHLLIRNTTLNERIQFQFEMQTVETLRCPRPRYGSRRMAPYILNLGTLWSVGRYSSVGIITLRAGRSGYRIPVGAKFSAPVQTGPGAHPVYCTMGTESLPGVKRLGSGADHPTPFSAEVKKREQLYLYSPSGPSWPVLG